MYFETSIPKPGCCFPGNLPRSAGLVELTTTTGQMVCAGFKQTQPTLHTHPGRKGLLTSNT